MLENVLKPGLPVNTIIYSLGFVNYKFVNYELVNQEFVDKEFFNYKKVNIINWKLYLSMFNSILYFCRFPCFFFQELAYSFPHNVA